MQTQRLDFDFAHLYGNVLKEISLHPAQPLSCYFTRRMRKCNTLREVWATLIYHSLDSASFVSFVEHLPKNR